MSGTLGTNRPTLAPFSTISRRAGLSDKSLVLGTHAIGDCPSDSFRNLPHIIWDDGGGYLKQGAYVDAFGTNNRILNALISAAIQDTGETVENFGSGSPGQLEVVLARARGFEQMLARTLENSRVVRISGGQPGNGRAARPFPSRAQPHPVEPRRVTAPASRG